MKNIVLSVAVAILTSTAFASAATPQRPQLGTLKDAAVFNAGSGLFLIGEWQKTSTCQGAEFAPPVDKPTVNPFRFLLIFKQPPCGHIAMEAWATKFVPTSSFPTSLTISDSAGDKAYPVLKAFRSNNCDPSLYTCRASTADRNRLFAYATSSEVVTVAWVSVVPGLCQHTYFQPRRMKFSYQLVVYQRKHVLCAVHGSVPTVVPTAFYEPFTGSPPADVTVDTGQAAPVKVPVSPVGP